MVEKPLLQMEVLPSVETDRGDMWLLDHEQAEMILSALDIVKPDDDEGYDVRDDLQAVFMRIVHLLEKGDE